MLLNACHLSSKLDKFILARLPRAGGRLSKRPRALEPRSWKINGKWRATMCKINLGPTGGKASASAQFLAVVSPAVKRNPYTLINPFGRPNITVHLIDQENVRANKYKK